MKFYTTLAGVALLAGLLTEQAEAQARRNVRPPIAKYQPYTSPYLNMEGPGGPAWGYFTGTLPQEEFRRQNYNFNRDLMGFENQVNANFKKYNTMQAGERIRRSIGTTGHPTGFMSYGGYFPGSR